MPANWTEEMLSRWSTEALEALQPCAMANVTRASGQLMDCRSAIIDNGSLIDSDQGAVDACSAAEGHLAAATAFLEAIEAELFRRTS